MELKLLIKNDYRKGENTLVVIRSEMVTKSKEKQEIYEEPGFTTPLGSILLNPPLNSIIKATGELPLSDQNGQHAGNN